MSPTAYKQFMVHPAKFEFPRDDVIFKDEPAYQIP